MTPTKTRGLTVALGNVEQDVAELIRAVIEAADSGADITVALRELWERIEQ